MAFNMELSKIDWTGILTSVDVNFCLSEFSRLFKSAIDVVAPYKDVRVRNKPNPWMNSEILASILCFSNFPPFLVLCYDCYP